MRRWCLALALLSSGIAHAEPGYIAKDAECCDRPDWSAKVLIKLSAHESIEILGRDGGWLGVKTGNVGGWVPIGKVRFGSFAARTQPVATTTAANAQQHSGIRGFSEEELSTVGSNPSAAERVKSISLPPGQAREFASNAGLKPRKQDYLDDPEVMSKMPPPEVLDE